MESKKLFVDVQGYGNGSATMTLGINTETINWTHGSLDLVRADEGEKILTALQFHFHAPSEHSVNGKLYDFEMHIVHLFPDGSLGGVLGFFFDRKAGGDWDNDFLSSFDFVNSDLDYDT